MKKIFILIVLIALVVGLYFAYTTIFREEYSTNMNSVEYNGWLKIDNTDLVNKRGSKIQLRGLSTHGIQWFNDLYSLENMKKLKEEWGINVIRAAMYTDPNVGGYIADKEGSKEKLYAIIDNAVELDMYVIVDWHILKDYNPNDYKEDAKLFFDEVSLKYKDTPNVIYEICNEPNGNVKWEEVKEYANEVIPIIRNNSPKSLILVGTPFWSKLVKNASESPLELKNIMYVCHFYAGETKIYGRIDEEQDNGEIDLKTDIEYCLENKIPVIISECGITDETGDGEIYEAKFRDWVEFFNEKNISWLFWSFSNKAESSSILKSEYDPNNKELNFNNYLTQTGSIIKSIFEQYAK